LSPELNCERASGTGVTGLSADNVVQFHRGRERGRRQQVCPQYGGDRTDSAGRQRWTYDVPADETATGTWTLRIGDNGYADTGVLTNWSITL
jgi:hypothetical protein